MTPSIDPLPDAVADCSPKAKLAYLYLAEYDKTTCGKLVAETHLPRPTANKALVELCEAGVAERRPHARKPGAFVYSLTGRDNETNV